MLIFAALFGFIAVNILYESRPVLPIDDNIIGKVHIHQDAAITYQLQLANHPQSWCGEIQIIPYLATCCISAIPFYNTRVLGFQFCSKKGWQEGINFATRYTRLRQIMNVVRISMRPNFYSGFKSLELIQLFKDRGYKFHSRLFTATDEVVMYDPLDNED
jgi:hypothetical protein